MPLMITHEMCGMSGATPEGSGTRRAQPFVATTNTKTERTMFVVFSMAVGPTGGAS